MPILDGFMSHMCPAECKTLAFSFQPGDGLLPQKSRFNAIALRMAQTLLSFGHSECNTAKGLFRGKNCPANKQRKSNIKKR